MNRRRFVSLAASAAAVCAANAARTALAEPPTAIGMPRTDGAVMPADFTGLSYESGQLYNPEFFSAHSSALVGAFRSLSRVVPAYTAVFFHQG